MCVGDEAIKMLRDRKQEVFVSADREKVFFRFKINNVLKHYSTLIEGWREGKREREGDRGEEGGGMRGRERGREWSDARPLEVKELFVDQVLLPN